MRRMLFLLLGLATAMVALMAGQGTAVATAPATVVDGMRLDFLPSGLGTASDFAYEFDDVGFTSRDWESRTDDGGYRVDLSMDVLRGEHLTTAREMHDWVISYEQRPADEVGYRRDAVRGRPGWRTADEWFWLVRPGAAVIVRLDTSRWTQRDLTRTAVGVHGR